MQALRPTVRIAALLMCLLFTLDSVAYAATPKNYDVLCVQAYDCAFFDPTASTENTCGSDSSLPEDASLKERKAYIYSVLVGSFGLKPYQAAGVMGNMAHESGFEPMRLQNTPPGTKTSAEQASGSSLGWGLVQWTPAGKMINTFEPKSKAEALNEQLEFLKKQLEGKVLSEKAAGDALKASKNISEATLAFETKYERHAGDPQPSRVETAKTILVELGSSSSDISGSSSAVCGAASSGNVFGEYSLPVDQKFYDKNREWFTKPHHNYPSADIPVPSGTKLFSVVDGKVTDMGQSGDNGGQGTFVKISKDNVVFTYMHGTPGSIKVQKGQSVKAGQLLMLSDNTGHSTGPHLHFQIDVAGQKRCPQTLLDAIGQKKTPPDISKLPSGGCTN